MSRVSAVTHIDLMPLGGIAGDMFAAAMFNAYPELYEKFCSDLDSLGIDGVSATLEDRLSKGLQAKYFNVVQNTSIKPPRTLAAVTEFLQAGALPESVATHATGLFTLLAEAEAAVHGKTVDTIHFHEVSDWDSMVDLVAAAGIIDRLNCKVWRVAALPTGGGTVNTAHGDIPVPAPATLALLQGYQWQDDGIPGERVTPTGAAILAYVKAVPPGAATMAANLVATGTGCGTRELDGRANILRVTCFANAAGATGSTDLSEDSIVRIAFEVDDMTAEEIAWATDSMRQSSGVHDVACVSMHGKKGRSSTGIRIIATAAHKSDVIRQCFAVTSTIGIRHETVQRTTLNRSEHSVDNVSVKIAARSPQQVTAKTASDDLASCTTLAERRRVAESIRLVALDRHNEIEQFEQKE